jgi:hypothetical protein
MDVNMIDRTPNGRSVARRAVLECGRVPIQPLGVMSHIINGPDEDSAPIFCEVGG